MKLNLRQTEITVRYEAAAALTAALLFDREGVLLCCLLCAMMHESGHLLMMMFFHVRIRSIRLSLFDTKIVSDEPMTKSQDLWITAAGVLMNFFLAAVCFWFSRRLFLSNLCIGIFNLLPVESLDGGRLLSVLLCKRFSPSVSDRVMRILSFFVLIPFLFGGIFILLRTGYNYSLLFSAVYLLAVLFFR